MPAISAHLLPSLLEGADLQGTTCVVIDILRASTTMVHALGNGARAVIPCLNVDDAHLAASRFDKTERLLGGERHGQLIAGFDLDNSPFRYGPETVAGKTVIFTTTNGTKALWESRQASRILVGAFSNITALLQALQQSTLDVHLICAGTDGFLTGEDVLFAGSVVQELTRTGNSGWSIGNLQGELACDFATARGASSNLFREAFYRSRGAENLVELGMQRDIDRAMERDLFTCVPVWNATTGELTTLTRSGNGEG